ncbi:NUDIX hydrolase [Microlunatus ginsengisoli]|uniref:NUDIX hydrolase n=1 Tax=Microlunatus ginsengisoli TaxID=363863 RepID=A0ABP7AD67_9ACTN
MEHDGNGWVQCGLGHRHWGRFGAAGLLLHRSADGAGTLILMQHRAVWTANGGTWGIPGGARDSHESAAQAALREAGEEAGVRSEDVAVTGEFADDHGAGWGYTTVLARLVRPFVLVPQEESEELRWVPVGEVDGLPLHPGFALSWPELRVRLEHAA